MLLMYRPGPLASDGCGYMITWHDTPPIRVCRAKDSLARICSNMFPSYFSPWIIFHREKLKVEGEVLPDPYTIDKSEWFHGGCQQMAILGVWGPIYLPYRQCWAVHQREIESL